MIGGFDAWSKANYPVETSITAPATVITKITSPFSLISGDPGGTVIPTGSVITHYVNGYTDVVGPDKIRLYLLKDADMPTQTDAKGVVNSITKLIHLPSGATVDGTTEGVTKFLIDGKVVLTIIDSRDNYQVS